MWAHSVLHTPCVQCANPAPKVCMVHDLVCVQGVMFVSHAMEIKASNLSSSIPNTGVFAETKVPVPIIVHLT